jgi:hypothetical protein
VAHETPVGTTGVAPNDRFWRWGQPNGTRRNSVGGLHAVVVAAHSVHENSIPVLDAAPRASARICRLAEREPH